MPCFTSILYLFSQTRQSSIYQRTQVSFSSFPVVLCCCLLFHVLPRRSTSFHVVPCFFSCSSLFPVVPPCSTLFFVDPRCSSLFHVVLRCSLLFFVALCPSRRRSLVLIVLRRSSLFFDVIHDPIKNFTTKFVMILLNNYFDNVWEK